MKRYELIGHTADLGIEVWGRNKEELFLNAAYAMFDLIAELANVNLKEKIAIKAKGENQDELLVNWLRKIHSYYAVRDYLFREFRISEFGVNNIRGSAAGEKISLKRHLFKKEIKAVTYHGVEIKKEGNLYRAQVIFDV